MRLQSDSVLWRWGSWECDQNPLWHSLPTHLTRWFAKRREEFLGVGSRLQHCAFATGVEENAFASSLLLLGAMKTMLLLLHRRSQAKKMIPKSFRWVGGNEDKIKQRRAGTRRTLGRRTIKKLTGCSFYSRSDEFKQRIAEYVVWIKRNICVE